MRKREKPKSWRLSLFVVFATLALLLLIGFLVDVQLLDRENLKLKGFDQYKYVVKLPPERGKIVDRNLNLLAFNVPTITVIANPKDVKNPELVAQKLAPLLGKSTGYLLRKLHNEAEFIYLARKQPKSLEEKIERLGLEGIECQTVMSRQYPKRQAACQLVGFTDIDGRGLSGVELAFERTLRGVPGKAVLQRTGRAHTFIRSEYPLIPPEDGQDVVLTIDHKYQYIAEKELAKTVSETGAQSGVVVIMDPSTGELLAMASEPSFDPNRAGIFDSAAWRLRPITDQFEPGSTFKTAVMAAFLDEGMYSPDDRIFCENGSYTIMGQTIHDTSPHGMLTVREVIIQSSNIGMAKLVMDFPANKLYDYLKAFGFGQKLDVELRGEIDGIFKPLNEWERFTPVALSYGHEVAATPLQMCNMFCTIANGGYRLQPTVVREVRKENKMILKQSPRVIQRVISQATADTLKEILYRAVEEGTGKKARIEGIQIAGKTGTSRIARTDQRGYEINKYFSSFGGFFPKENPKIVVFVMINNPRGNYYGGEVASPCFQRIAKQIIAREGLDFYKENSDIDDLFEKKTQKLIPNLIGYRRPVALKLAQEHKLRITTVGDGNIIVSQEPLPGSVHSGDERILLITEQRYESQPGDRVVPDVIGLPIRNALNVLAIQKISVVVDGTGRVVQQKPAAGQALKPSEQVLLFCESSIDVGKILAL